MQFALTTCAPFHLEATVRVLQRRPGNRVDVWHQDRYLRVLVIADVSVLVEVHNRGTIDAPDLRFAIRSGSLAPRALPHLRRTLCRVLGLDVDPGPLQRQAESEPALRATALALRGMRPPRFVDLFEAFARVVPFQQMSLDAGVAITGRLIEHFGDSMRHGGRHFHAFPTARRIARARLLTLRACGLSTGKAETLRKVAQALEAGTLDEASIACMTTADALQKLNELPGIGPWSAALVLLRGFGRLDVFPPGDVGATRGLSSLLQIAPGVPLERAIQRFGNLRGYLYFYSLGANLLKKGLIHSALNEKLRRVSASPA
jgi:3-methyladenine DNA glycosylase/8-oxoguanine DNA glycosylase